MTNLESFLAQLVSIIASISFLYFQVKKWTVAQDKENTKDFLVIEFARADRHELSIAEKLRIKERYDHYVLEPEKGGLGGNSYIKEEYTRLKAEKKI